VGNAKYCSSSCRAVAKRNTTRLWVESHKEEIRQYSSQYYKKNKSKKIVRDKEYRRHKMKTDINYKLRQNLRKRLCKAIKNNQKKGSAIGDLGCSIEELKKHLEAQFQPGMSWDNYGKWHVDHIKPLVSFDLTNHEELKRACHYSNLQPLWAKDNLGKGDKIERNE
jgi:hypothetical protein